MSLMIGCDVGERNGGGADTLAAEPPPSDVAGAPAAGDSTVVDDRAVVLFMGTSLTAGRGLPLEQSFPMIVADSLAAHGLPYRVVNAGVSGETSSGALRRMDWVLSQPVEILVLETGANDMLRGGSPEALEDNLQAIVDRVRSERPETAIILAGMRAMPNLGAAYVADFEEVYPRVAQRNDLTLIPFLLDGVAGNAEMNLADGIHPNPEGQHLVAANVLETLVPVLEADVAR